MTTLYSVTSPDWIGQASYSPDGSLVVFAEKVGSDYNISTITTDTMDYAVLITNPSGPYSSPSFSADGLFILYSFQISAPSGPEPYGQWSIYYNNADGSNQTPVVDDGNANLNPCWVTPIQIAFQWWQYGATPSDVFMIDLIDLAGQGRATVGEGEYPRVVTT